MCIPIDQTISDQFMILLLKTLLLYKLFFFKHNLQTMGTIGDKINCLSCCNGDQRKLRQVNKLPIEESNIQISNKSILQNNPQFIGNNSAFYIPYNHIYQDKGWGCAWRAIQMVLSAYKIDNQFLELFKTYSKQQKLLSIIREHKLYDQRIIQNLTKSEFAPQNATNNWAEPFICKLICSDKKIKSRLFLLNGYPYANAPKEVFPETKTFKQFAKIVKSSIINSPVMIDDGTLAMVILAYNQPSPYEHQFIIGDPHILSNRNNNQVGIYKITCDSQGKQIKNEYDQQSIKQAYIKTLSSMEFFENNWMVLVTDGFL